LKPEKLDELGNQIDPPGFQLIILPYADEIRQIPPHTEVQGKLNNDKHQD